jgi:hypothetical protein
MNNLLPSTLSHYCLFQTNLLPLYKNRGEGMHKARHVKNNIKEPPPQSPLLQDKPGKLSIHSRHAPRVPVRLVATAASRLRIA